MELKQLRYFQTVCQLNNITKAAEKLYVSQPSITNSIKNLEKELSIILFDRSKKQLVLTPEGKVFLDKVNEILGLVDDTIVEMRDYKNLKKGILTIGVPPMIGTFVFPKVFTDFKKTYPNIQLNIIENGSVTTKRMIEKGELDIGLIIIDSSNKLLTTYPIYNSELLVCLNHQHPLSKKSALSFDNIKNEPIILLKEGFYIREKILDFFNTHNVEPNIILSSNQLETIKGLVINGGGISFLLREIVEGNEKIVKIPFANGFPIKIALVCKKDRCLSNVSKAFIDFIIANPRC